MKYKNILMLWPSKSEYWGREIAKKNLIHIDATYIRQGLVGNILRKTAIQCGTGFSLFFEKWKDQIYTYDLIIVQANMITKDIPKWIRNRGYKGRLVYWYWDPVSGCVSPDRIDRRCCELWSFDKVDCEKYNMKFRETFFVTNEIEIKKQRNSTEYMHDILFVGRDKGRADKLDRIQKELEYNKLTTFFYVVATKPYYISAGRMKKQLDYQEVLIMLQGSRAILEINQKDQSGLSMRTMESIFFSKKLITDNAAIMQSEIYRPENIYVLGQDKRNIRDFMNVKYIEYSQDFLNRYLFETWITSFAEE